MEAGNKDFDLWGAIYIDQEHVTETKKHLFSMFADWQENKNALSNNAESR